MSKLRFIFRYILFTSVLTCGFSSLSAQEIIEPLKSNPILQKASKFSFITRRAITDTLEITNNSAFADDFSQTGYYPNDSLWLDRNVFINSTSAHYPPSFGVATFDGLNEFGVPYLPGYVENKGATCDTLTSIPINLKPFQVSDSLFLSFFYQAQGYGEEPDTYDSLVLEFKPDSLWMGSSWSKENWVRVWSVPGSRMKPFTQVILNVKHYEIDSTEEPIRVANFYHGGFQFRFINYGNLSGNLDLWHLDYVYLNKNRSSKDTIYEDITVVKLPQHLLNDYSSVPASHLRGDNSLFRDNQYMYIQNMFGSPINVRGTYLVEDLSDQHILIYNANSSSNINPRQILKLNVYDSILLQFPFNQLKGDTIMLQSRAYSYYLQDVHKENDMVLRIHEFNNYYAYDDGTAENGYSIDLGSYKSGRVAYRFKLASNVNNTDSLRGISFYFNYSEQDGTGMPFNLMVWKDYKSDPVRLIETTTPIVKDSLMNGYYTYRFEHPVGIDSFADAGGEFYVGWEQYTPFRMNVGLDRNYFELTGDSLPNKANPNIHYFTANSWKSSIASGALMIRPIISKNKLILPSSLKDQPANHQLITKIYPNPARNYLNILTGTKTDVVMSIIDMQGRELKSTIINNEAGVTLDGFNPGIYIVILTDIISQSKYYHKFIIQE
jgi:hypothetical protein